MNRDDRGPAMKHQRVHLEICIASVEDAQAAEAGGADRLELNSALDLGGLTPSLGCLDEVRRAVRLPIMVMIRPRSGGFAYRAAEFKVLQRDLDLALEHGADGIVVGVLNADGSIDLPRCRELVGRTGDREVVFHRAFDVIPDPFVALEQLIDLGFTRVMTSGQEASAHAGRQCIAGLIQRAAGRIQVLPAGGINRLTVAEVIATTGCDQVHASLRTRCPDTSTATRPHLKFSTPAVLSDSDFPATDAAAVTELGRLLHGGRAPEDGKPA
jgi:copper homeostasis protein